MHAAIAFALSEFLIPRIFIRSSMQGFQFAFAFANDGELARCKRVHSSRVNEAGAIAAQPRHPVQDCHRPDG